MNEIKLVVCDIDGTLIPKGKEDISDILKDAFKQLEEKGIHLLVATGRHYLYTQPKLFESLNNEYIITINGSSLNKMNGEIVSYHTIPEETLWKIVNICEKHDIGLGLKFKDNIVTYHNHEKFMKYYFPEKIEWQKRMVNDCANRSYHKKHDLPCGVFFVGNEEEIERLFHGRMDNLIISRGIKNGFDVFLEDVNKATGVEEYMKLYNLSWENTIAFGDSGNDVAMLKKAHIGVTFEDSKDFVKEVCEYITTTCEEDGVYNALKHFNIIE